VTKGAQRLAQRTSGEIAPTRYRPLRLKQNQN